MFQESQEYRPRFGYKRVNNGVEDQPIVEIKVTGQAVSRCHRRSLTAFPLTPHPIPPSSLSLSVGMGVGVVRRGKTLTPTPGQVARYHTIAWHGRA